MKDGYKYTENLKEILSFIKSKRLILSMHCTKWTKSIITRLCFRFLVETPESCLPATLSLMVKCWREATALQLTLSVWLSANYVGWQSSYCSLEHLFIPISNSFVEAIKPQNSEAMRPLSHLFSWSFRDNYYLGSEKPYIWLKVHGHTSNKTS